MHAVATVQSILREIISIATGAAVSENVNGIFSRISEVFAWSKLSNFRRFQRNSICWNNQAAMNTYRRKYFGTYKNVDTTVQD